MIRHRRAAVALTTWGHAAVSLWLNSGVPATEVARCPEGGIDTLPGATGRPLGPRPGERQPLPVRPPATPADEL